MSETAFARSIGASVTRPPAPVATWDAPSWTLDALVAAKAGRTVSVVLPALNEAESIGAVIESIAPLHGSLVDEIIVLDSDSTDATAERARAAGASVVARGEVFPHIPPLPGKGEALWRGVAAASGDLIAFVDSDLVEPDPRFVPNLLGPLLFDPSLALVKAYYRRPFGADAQGTGGGRVTELVARPLLSAFAPALTDIIQPLGGEYAGTREFLTSVPFANGYGVEIAMLLDAYQRHGRAAIGQVNLGVRRHRNRPLDELGVMSRHIVGTLLARCGITDSGAALTQFVLESEQNGPAFVPRSTAVALWDRPPVASVQAVLPG